MLNKIVAAVMRRVGKVNTGDRVYEIKNIFGMTLLDFGREGISRAALAKYNFAGMNLRHADLSGMDFRRANFESCNLEGADLSNSFFWYCNLRAANLWCAKASGSTFYMSNLGQARAKQADFQNACFVGTNLAWADFRIADLAGATGNSSLEFTKLQGANIEGNVLLPVGSGFDQDAPVWAEGGGKNV